jgi:hypothetical protein
VAEQTLQRAAELRLHAVMLPCWYDVDDAVALGLLVGDAAGSTPFSAEHRSFAARHSTALLQENGWMSAVDTDGGD